VILDITAADLADSSTLETLARRHVERILIRRDDCLSSHCDQPLIARGYVEAPDVAGDSSYRVFMWHGA
jgi:hypothetical protein